MTPMWKNGLNLAEIVRRQFGWQYDGSEARNKRWFTLGTSSTGSLLAVSHTYQHTGPIHVKVRLISARPATRAERKQYENEPR